MPRLLLCFLLFLAACVPGSVLGEGPTPRPTTFDLTALSGNWEGGIKGSTSTYTIKVLINPMAAVGQVAALVEYPSIGCRGNWKLKAKSAAAYVFSETILQGLSTCSPEGVVELMYDPTRDLLEYSWRDPRGGSGEKGVLKRVK